MVGLLYVPGGVCMRATQEALFLAPSPMVA